MNLMKPSGNSALEYLKESNLKQIHTGRQMSGAIQCGQKKYPSFEKKKTVSLYM